MTPEVKYSKFIKRLEQFKSERIIKILKRGVSKKFAFELFNLDLKYNTLDQYAEKLFYFGEKSRYFWDNKVDNEFSIGETGEKVTKYIFNQYQKISYSKELKIGTQKFIDKNKLSFDYFSDNANCELFINEVRILNDLDRRKCVNYFLRILHQLSEFKYKENSINVSGTERESVAKGFSKNEIIIDFWDFDFNHYKSPNKSIPAFIGKPYKSQKEISVFGVIFPHYILSFRCNGYIYYNPALLKETLIDNMIISGFDIDQKDFIKRLKKETIFKSALSRTHDKCEELETLANNDYN